MKRSLYEIVSNVDFLSYDKIKEVLRSTSCIKDYAFILHDKDVEDDGKTLKKPHYHVDIRLTQSRESKEVGKWFGVAENFVGACNHGFDGALKYLTHIPCPEKYQYADDEVESNFDWKSERDKSVEMFEEKKNKKNDRLSEIISLIDTEVLREFNKVEYVTNEEWVKYKSFIKSSFEYVYDRLNIRLERNMDVIFITGGTGKGKTQYSKKICRDKGYSAYVSSGGKNPLDDYKGQDVIILDDLRGSDYKYNELLKLLDNNTASMCSCRYYNKSLAYCKMIIVTSIKPMEEWYLTLQEHEQEPLGQLKRRCKTYITMNDETMDIRLYNEYTGDYDKPIVVSNPVSRHSIEKQEMTQQQKIDKLNGLLGGVELVNEYGYFQTLETIPDELR